MSDPTLPPEVEAALRDLYERAIAHQPERDACYEIEDGLREAYRLGLAAGREDGELLDWLEQYQPTADEDGEMLIALVGSWTFNRVRHNEGLRAAIRAAKEADRG